MKIEKPDLVQCWREHLLAKLSVLRQGQTAARAGTRVDGDHRPENRGERAAVTSQGYLALGLGQRTAEIEEQLRLLEEMGSGSRDRVVVGAVVHLEADDGVCSWIAVFPGGDATELHVKGACVRVLSARAPLAAAIYGLETGDAAEFSQAGKAVEVVVLSVF